MYDQDKYKSLNENVTFSNGKSFTLYSMNTKKGIRYFYFSPSNGRMMPISKIDAGIL
jgi:hypothetical protein